MSDLIRRGGSLIATLVGASISESLRDGVGHDDALDCVEWDAEVFRPVAEFLLHQLAEEAGADKTRLVGKWFIEDFAVRHGINVVRGNSESSAPSEGQEEAQSCPSPRCERCDAPLAGEEGLCDNCADMTTVPDRDVGWRQQRVNTIAREHIISPQLRHSIKEALHDAGVRVWARERESCRNCVKVASEMGENRMRAAVIGELREPSGWLIDAAAGQIHGDDLDGVPVGEHTARKVFRAIADSLDINTQLSIDLSADEAKCLEPER